MPAPTWRFPISLLTAVLLFQEIFVLCFVATPFLLLLLLPCACARQIFEWFIEHVMAVNLAMGCFILRVGSGCKVFLHCQQQHEELLRLGRCGAPILVTANHRTTLCWAYIWGLGAALRRLRGYRIVMMNAMRFVPCIGWISQIAGMVFIDRGLGKKDEKNSEAQLDTLRSTVEASSTRSRPLCLQIFPEGRPLFPGSIKASDAYADKLGLPHYRQVLHPKTRGFEVSWQAFQELPVKPVLVDVTLAFVDYAMGEVPNHAMIGLGRCPSEVHIVVDIIRDPAADGGLDAVCKEIFRKKEERLTAWYDSETLEGRKRNLSRLLGHEPGKYVGVFSSNMGYFLYCSLFLLVCEAILVATFWHAGWLALLGTVVSMAVFYTAAAKYAGGVDSWVRWHARKWPRQETRRKEAGAERPLL